jgi:hypothetical protein
MISILWKRGIASQPPETRLEQASGPGPKRKGGRGESVAAAEQAPGPRHSRTRFLQVEPLTLPLPSRATVACHCNKGSQSAESTTEEQRAPRALLRARHISSFDGGRSRSMGPAQPRPTAFPCTLSAGKTAVACNVVEAQVVPAQSAAASVTSALSFSLCCLLASGSCSRHCPGPHPQPSATWHFTHVL